MRRHSKAPSARSNLRQAAGLRRHGIAFALLVTLLVFAGIGASTAGARIVHPFKENFGSSAQPTFINPMSLAVDPVGGDLIAVDAGANEKQALEIKVASGSVGGTYQLTFGGKTTGWTGTGTVTCNGSSTTITGVTTSTGALVSREQIRSTPGSCIKPGTLITSFNVGVGTITLSQATENNASSGSVSLASDLAVSGSPSNPTGEQIGNSIREALEKLPSIGAGNLTVPFSSNATSPITRTIEFKNALGAADVAPITCDGTGLTGTSPTCTIATTRVGAPNGIKRFKPDGTPDNFSALGTNVIDGRLGAGAQACGEEASSCDVTPQGFLAFGESPARIQVAVDRSGGVTNGDIFVAIEGQGLVDVFAADGHFVGQLTQYRNFSNEAQKVNFAGSWASGSDTFELGNLPADCSASSTGPITYSSNGGNWELAVRNPLRALCGGEGTIGVFGNTKTINFGGKYEGLNIAQLTCTPVSASLGGTCSVETTIEGGVPSPSSLSPCGVTVSSTGLYLGGNSVVQRWVPTANPPLLADNVFNFVRGVTGILNPCNLAAGTAGTAGFLFGAGSGGVNKFDPVTGKLKYAVASGSTTAVTVNPANGRVLTVQGKVATEYDASGSVEATKTSTLTATGEIQGIAVDGPSGNVYVSRAGASKVEIFGPPVPTPTPVATAATAIGAVQATLNGSVNAEGTTVTSCVFEYGPTTAYGSSKPCSGDIPADSNPHAVSAAISGLNPNGATYHYRIVAVNVNGSDESADHTFATGSSMFTEPASSIASTTATVNGSVNPVGLPLTECKFEYGTALDYGQSKPCTQSLGSIEADFQSHAVSAALAGLSPNTLYHFRFVVKNAQGTLIGADRTFTTVGAPQIVEQRPLDVTQTTATLQARINPSGSPTAYYFEFGTDTSYGIRIPADHDLFLGSGTEPIIVSASRSGLQESSVYHFRVVATNAGGTASGPDQRLETLNEHGLPDNRAFELVTPTDKGSAGSLVKGFSFQVSGPSADGNSFIWPLQNGLPDSTAGGWLRLTANRSAEGWRSTQLSSPSLIPPPRIDGLGFALPSRVLYASADDSCGLLQTYNPITADTPKLDVELGVEILYLWRAEAGHVTYQLISNRVPLNAGVNPADGGFYKQIEAADDCSRVYFQSAYQLIAGASGLYEWEEGESGGTLRDAGARPDGSIGPSFGTVIGSAVPGAEIDIGHTARWNAVSPSGSHFFYTTTSDAGPDSGTPAVFMRADGGAQVTDISQSQTAVGTKGARFETASPDGGMVIFRANYGIAGTTSSGPTNAACGPLSGETEVNANPSVEAKACDLYAYDVDTEQLVDLSADPNPADSVGAQVQGAVAVDKDGSHVYFAALGQLVPGRGRTYAENTAGEGSSNIYLSHDGQLSYVATLRRGAGNDLLSGALMRRTSGWTVQTSADGETLAFESTGTPTWYESGGGRALYVYSAVTGKISCVSCPPDGAPTLVPPSGEIEGVNLLSRAITGLRSMNKDGSRVFFTSPDVLASGAIASQRNVYEWEDGQVFFLAIAKREGKPAILPELATYEGASTTGDDVFLSTNQRLAPQDRDSVADVYDLRVDGGFPVEPLTPDCQVDESVPLVSNQIYCQGDKTPPPPASSSPASTSFSGPGNPPAQEVKQKKPHKKKHRKKHKRAHRAHKRAANTDRGGAK